MSFKTGKLAKKLFFVFFFAVFLFLSPNFISAQNNIEIYFFWGQGCPHCAQEKPFLDQLKQKYPQLEIKEFEIYNSKENQDLFNRIVQAYNTQPYGVPMTFIGKNFVVGFNSEDTTGKEIEDLVENCLNNYCPSPNDILLAGGIDKIQQPTEKKQTIQIPIFGHNIEVSSNSSLIFLGVVLGLADGINPCMFSVLFFLLTYLLAVGSKKRAVNIGLVFSVSVFIIYFLFMVGMINLISLVGFINKIKIVVAVFALIAGLIMIKDFFAYGKGISLSIPKSVKPVIGKLAKKGTIPSAILLAVLSSFVELPCTAGIPLVYTTLLAGKTGNYIPYLILYNFFFIVPLLIIITAISFAWAKIEKMENWRLNARKYMRLVAGLILLFLSVALFLGWL